jgi:cobalamin biosynthetic protein CobC
MISSGSGGVAHGGSLAAGDGFPDAPRPLLDLSTGINPVAYPMPGLPAASFARLPEPGDVQRLQRVAARAYGVGDAAMVAAAPGTQILIGLLPLLWPQRRVAVLGPTYAEHAACWARSGADVADVADLDHVGDARCVVVCNPNNPDGRVVAARRLLAMADWLAAVGGLLVVDEAFADFEGSGVSVADALPHPAMIVLRSFGKSFGLAGVRLGFALADPARAGAIRAALGPWAVSGPAISVGGLALGDRVWRATAAARLACDAARMDGCLRAAGLAVVGGTRLFRLAACDDADAVFERLGRAGVLVRRFAERPGWLRFGLPADAAGWDRLGSALGVQKSARASPTGS